MRSPRPHAASVHRAGRRSGSGSSSGSGRRSGADRASPWFSLLAATLVLLGVGLLLYPSAAAWLFELRSRGIVAAHVEESARLDPGAVAASLDAAREYNRTLTHGLIVDPFGTAEVDTALDADARHYLTQLVPGGGDVMATLEIPRLGTSLPVYHGATDQVLRRGVGHIYGSSLPVGGAGTHAVLTAHSGIPEAELFTRLDTMRPGDVFTVRVFDSELAYRVTGSDVVEPTDIANLAVVPGEDLVTLVTCTPTGVNTHRLLVHAERVPLTSAAPADRHSGQEFPWWSLGIGAAAALWAATLLSALRGRRGADRARH